MDLPHKDREINGTTYRATNLTLEDWAVFGEFLAEILGEPMASILRGDSVLKGNLDRRDLEVIIAELAGKITSARILGLSKHMGKGLCTIAPDHILGYKAQNMWWPGHMKDLGPVVALFLEVQYVDFFEGLADSLPEIRQIGDGPLQKDS